MYPVCFQLPINNKYHIVTHVHFPIFRLCDQAVQNGDAGKTLETGCNGAIDQGIAALSIEQSTETEADQSEASTTATVSSSTNDSTTEITA